MPELLERKLRAVKVHEPKLAAIRAEAAGLLSSKGRQRLAQHVATCALCAEHLRGARRFQFLSGRADTLPAFDGAIAAQRAHTRSIRARRRAALAFGAFGLAAAAAVLVFFRVEQGPIARSNETSMEAASDASAVPSRAARGAAFDPTLAVEITALAGQARMRDASDVESAIDMSSLIGEGMAIETGPHAELDLVLGTAAAIRFDADTKAGLELLREHRVVIRLDAGQVANAVAPRGADQSYEVLAHGNRVLVRGTLFAVRIAADGELSVQCDEGSVAIIGADGVIRDVLRAPAQWSERGGLTGLTTAIAKGREHRPVARPQPHVPNAALLTLPGMPGVTAWEIGDQDHRGGELHMRVPPGELDVTALLANGRRETVRLMVDPLGTRVGPADLPFMRARQPEPRGAGDQSAVTGNASAVIQAGRPALQRCYERSLKNESSGSLSLRLGVVLDSQGRVRKVESALADGSTRALPPALVECIRTTVSHLRFPPPGADGARLEAPLRFQLRR